MNRAAWIVVALFVVACYGDDKAPYPIDLPTALRLAGAQNLDVQLAREKLAEARANHENAIEQFFPWIAPGVGYHRRDGMAQAVPAGTVSRTDLQSYAPGATVVAQVDIGNAYFKSLEAHQLVTAATHALDAQRQDSLLAAAQGYYELAIAQGLVGVAQEAVRISGDYEDQVQHAVEAGIAFKGDELRVRTQTRHYQLLLRQAQEQQRVAAARLAETLHLDSTVELVAQEAELVPLTLAKADEPLDALVQKGFAARPELKQSAALVAAAREAKNGAAYGPLIPSAGVQGFVGGFGGGHDDQPQRFGNSEDLLATLSWRIGPGGLFDSARDHAAAARLNGAQLAGEKVQDEIRRQVVESATRLRSLVDQIATARQALANAEETLWLTQQRKEFGVGIVLEYIQAEQDLTRARNDYLTVVAEHNKAQYALRRAIGEADLATGQ